MRDFFIYLWDLRRQNFEGESGDRNGVHAARRPPDNADRNFVGGDGGEGIVGAGQINIRNAEDVAALLEVLAAQLEDHIEQMFGDMLVLIWGLFHLLENTFSVSMLIFFLCFTVFLSVIHL